MRHPSAVVVILASLVLFGCQSSSSSSVTTTGTPSTQQPPRSAETPIQAMDRLGVSYDVVRNTDGSVKYFTFNGQNAGRFVTSVRGVAVSLYAYDNFTTSNIQLGPDLQPMPATWYELRWYDLQGNVLVSIPNRP